MISKFLHSSSWRVRSILGSQDSGPLNLTDQVGNGSVDLPQVAHSQGSSMNPA